MKLDALNAIILLELALILAMAGWYLSDPTDPRELYEVNTMWDSACWCQ